MKENIYSVTNKPTKLDICKQILEVPMAGSIRAMPDAEQYPQPDNKYEIKPTSKYTAL